MDTNTILGVLGGSIGTVIITKFFEYFSEKRIFKRELKRQFFAKKLEAAEKATKFYVSSINYYAMLQTSLELFIIDGDITYFSALSNEAITKCKSLWDMSNDQLNMISLYFDDAKPITWYPADNVSKTSLCLSEYIKGYNEAEELNVKLKNAKIANQVDLVDSVKIRYAILNGEMKQIAKELIKCIDFEKGRNDYYKKVIRNELKKYDV